MREIKFRAWVTDTKTMLSWNEIKDIPMQQLETSNYPHMQYTGLKDKNGKDIYEGDIFGEFSFQGDYANEDEPFGKVYFDNDLSAFCVDQKNGGWDYLHNIYQKPRVSIIGNIYENPELLSTNPTTE